MTLREFIEGIFNNREVDKYLGKRLIIQHIVSNEGGVSLDGVVEITIFEIVKPDNHDQPIVKMRFNTRLHEHDMNIMEWHDLAWCAQYEVLVVA